MQTPFQIFKHLAKRSGRRQWKHICAVTACCLLLFASSTFLSAPALAEPVSVNSPAGQGFAFSHKGNCFIVLPEHVHGAGTTLSLSAGSPPTIGAADVLRSFPDMDLSIASVTGGLAGRCAYDFNSFPTNVDDVISLGGQATLVNVSAAGRVDRVSAQVTSIGYDALTVSLAEGFDIHQGRSGSIILAGDTPVAMLIEVSQSGEGYALRIDSIVERISRLLRRRPTPTDRAADSDLSQSTNINSAGGLTGLPASLTSCSSEAASPEANCWAFASGDTPLLFTQQSLPFSMDIAIEGGSAVIRQVRLWANSSPDETAVPKSIIVLRAAGPRSRPSWLTFGNADMSPQGQLVFSQDAGLRTWGLRIVIRDGWAAEDLQAIRLDGIQIR